MKVYNTLIIGSGYTSIGYAAACESAIICDEHQVCDTHFYLPLRSFRHQPYLPKTEEGAHLLDCFRSLSLFEGEAQNTNGFEFALCKYICQKEMDVLLKCRVVGIERTAEGFYDATVQTNEGLTHLYAERILDTTSKPNPKRYTVLFVCEDIEAVKPALLSAFADAQVEPAFYQNRYALHLSAGDTDENRIKADIYEQWRSLPTDAKILYMAPTFYADSSENQWSDYNYPNPIEAFEAGYFYAKEADR